MPVGKMIFWSKDVEPACIIELFGSKKKVLIVTFFVWIIFNRIEPFAKGNFCRIEICFKFVFKMNGFCE